MMQLKRLIIWEIKIDKDFTHVVSQGTSREKTLIKIKDKVGDDIHAISSTRIKEGLLIDLLTKGQTYMIEPPS